MSLQDVPIENRLLVEVGWEICWQLGGIYTVLRSKAPETVSRWGTRYCLLGPYNHKTAEVEFEPLPRTGYFGRAVELLQQRGIHAHYGRWLITGKPQVVLIDYLRSFDRLADFKYYLWKDHVIETRDEQEVNDVVLFGYLAAEFFQALAEVVQAGDPDSAAETGSLSPKVQLPILGHFHEWMAGIAIPVIGKRQLPVVSVFTTHATILGRYLASDDPNFYHYLSKIDPNGAAQARGIYPRFTIERAAANGATCFTTVSEVTALEAEHFLGRKPDLLLPNGLNIQRFAALHEFQNLHLSYKQKIQEFVMGHFFSTYTFDLDKTLFLFTSGRYEYRNKGYDLFIEGLARLNWRLKCTKSGQTVVAFIVSRAATRGINVDVLKSQVLFGELRSTCANISEQMGRHLLQLAAQGKMPHIEDLLDEYATTRLKRMTHAWKRHQWPAIVTHDMAHDAEDPILKQLRFCNLVNGPDDPVKVVFHPEFLSSTSPIVGLDYDQFVRGCHLGVFPSYYEPWGYTPMECAALGIPAITSDLAGFGTYLLRNIPHHAEKGLWVLERRHKSFEESAEQLADLMQHVVSMNRRERVEQRNRVESLSEQFDWKQLAQAYWEAHSLALSRATGYGNH